MAGARQTATFVIDRSYFPVLAETQLELPAPKRVLPSSRPEKLTGGVVQHEPDRLRQVGQTEGLLEIGDALR